MRNHTHNPKPYENKRLSFDYEFRASVDTIYEKIADICRELGHPCSSIELSKNLMQVPNDTMYPNYIISKEQFNLLKQKHGDHLKNRFNINLNGQLRKEDCDFLIRKGYLETSTIPNITGVEVLYVEQNMPAVHDEETFNVDTETPRRLVVFSEVANQKALENRLEGMTEQTNEFETTGGGSILEHEQYLL